MQINTNIRQLDLKEYKLILNTTSFSGTGSDKEILVDTIKKIINEMNLDLKQSEEKPKQKNVWYFDTNEHDFYKNNNFTVRVKETKKDNGKYVYDATFKVRTTNQDKTLSYDLEPKLPQEEFKIEEQKFEEDIISQLGSQFALSTELEFKKDKYENRFNKTTTTADVLALFPNLKLNVMDNKILSHVNGVKVQETSYEIGELLFEDMSIAKIEFSIWNMLDDSEKPTETVPVIGEFDIDVSLNNSDTGNDQTKTSNPSLKEIEALYKKMQSECIVDINGTTKTKFIYTYNKNET